MTTKNDNERPPGAPREHQVQKDIAKVNCQKNRRATLTITGACAVEEEGREKRERERRGI